MKFSSMKIAQKIKTDNDLNIRGKKKSSSSAPAPSSSHTTPRHHRCASSAERRVNATVSDTASAFPSVLTRASMSRTAGRTLDSPSLPLPPPTPLQCFAVSCCVLNWRWGWRRGPSSGSELESITKILITELCSQGGQVAHHRQTVANPSHDRGRGSPEPKGWGLGSEAAGARGPAQHKRSCSTPARGCVLLPEPRGAAWGWLDRLWDCARSHGRLSVSAPYTAPNSSDFCPCPPHSSSAWTSLPQSLPWSREHGLSRAHQHFPLLFPTRCSVGRDRSASCVRCCPAQSGHQARHWAGTLSVKGGGAGGVDE